MIKQFMSDTETCPHCDGAVYPSNVRIYHVDNPSENGFLWAYQEKSQDTMEIEYECACGMFSDRLQVFCDYKGDLYISPLQTVLDKKHVLKPPFK